VTREEQGNAVLRERLINVAFGAGWTLLDRMPEGGR
jgi:hypothetical protein